MSLWKLPHGSDDHDETCVEVTVFDNKNVPINGYVFGKNSAMNRGLNFMFTLNAMPFDGNEVFFDVFKKAYNKEQNFLGRGNIPIDKIFGDLLSQVFKDADTKKFRKQVRGKSNSSVESTDGMRDTNRNAKSNKASAIGMTKVQSNASVTSTSNGQVLEQNETQAQDSAVIASSNKVLANVAPIKNLKTVSVASSSQGSVMSSLSKDVYPIIGCDGTQWGTICILMRLTSFGRFSAHPILLHKNDKDIILQNTPNSATYKCVALDDIRKNRKDDRKHVPSASQRTDLAPHSSCSSSTSSASISTNIRRINSNINRSDSVSSLLDLCPGPPVSPSDEYEEFTAEINENILCIRVPKDAGTVKRIYDDKNSFRTMDPLRNSENEYPKRKIPIIRGNKKYPACYGTISSIANCSESNKTVYDPRQKSKSFGIQCNENLIRQDDNINCSSSNVQITRRNTDPKRDVFLLNIGRDERFGSGIQLEMKTPKNPVVRGLTNKQSTSVQTYDDEFVGGGHKSSGKTGGKKGKKK